MIKEFLRYIETEKRYSKHTITAYENDLKQFSVFIEKAYQITTELANYPMIRSWIVELAENEIGTKSINRKISVIRSFYGYLEKMDLIIKNPTLKIIAPKISKKLPVFVEEDNLNLFLDRYNFTNDFDGVRDNLVMELLYGTGIRLSELINLKTKDVNHFDNSLKVLGKGDKERIVPMTKMLIKVISQYKEAKKKFGIGIDSEYFVLTGKGEQTYEMLIYRIVKKYLNQITLIEKKSPHVLRHSFATHLLNKEVDLNAIKDLLGHANLLATQQYTHTSLDKIKEIFDRAHPKSGKE